MRVELLGFSQGVSLSNKDEHTNYLDFRTETGKEFRIPVSEEAMNALLAQVYGEEPRATPPPSREPETTEPDATVFGDEDEVRLPDDVPAQVETEEEPQEMVATSRGVVRRSSRPTREEDIPSL